MDLFRRFKHPYTCCKYPQQKILSIHEENCKSKCSSSGSTSCCMIDCNYRETGVIVNGIFNEQAMMKLYENYLDDNGAGKYDQCMEISEKPSQKWKNSQFQFYFSVPHSDKIYTYKVPEYVVDITDCVNLMNYLNCPTFDRTIQCELARDFVRSLYRCGKNVNGTTLLSYEYWDFQIINPKKHWCLELDAGFENLMLFRSNDKRK